MVDELNIQIEKMISNKKASEIGYTISKKISRKARMALIDLELNHNNSWSVEMFLINKNKLDNNVLFYRGNKINGYEFWTNVYKFCKSFKEMGITKGSEVPVMVSNSPEFIYSLTALNMIGAVSNIVGEWFAEDYLVDIIRDTKSKVILVSDDINEKMQNSIVRSPQIEKIITFSLTDSLPKDKEGNHYNPYAEIDDKFEHFKNNVSLFKKKFSEKIVSKNEFLEKGETYEGNIVEDMSLSDLCQITYTSGTTKPGYPKGCKHSNRNYLTLARFKCSDVSTMPTMKKLIVLAHLPSYTQTVMSTAYTDPLYMGWTIACEPYYDINFYPYSLLINKPNYTVETPEYEKYVAKLLDKDENWKIVKMPFRVCVCVAGQELSTGLEKYLNIISRKHKYGVEKLPFPFAPVKITIAGGTTENGGFLVTLFKNLQEKRLDYLIKNKNINLMSIGLADARVLNNDGKPCKPYERGMLYVDTPTNQIGYVNEEFNKGREVVADDGVKLMSTGTYAYQDEFGTFRMLDRPGNDITLENGESVPFYVINDLIRLDTKNIMESYIVKLPDNELVCHIEKQPDSKKSDEQLVNEIRTRLSGKIDECILDNMFLRFRTFEEGFPVAGSGKTDLIVLANEDISNKVYKLNEGKNLTRKLEKR